MPSADALERQAKAAATKAKAAALTGGTYKKVGTTTKAPAAKAVPNVKPATSFTPGVSGGGLMRANASISGQNVAPISFDTTDNGTGEVNYGTATLDNPAPAPVADTSVETLRATPEYMARERALAAAMELFGQTQATEQARYGKSYDESLAELGYDPTKGSFDFGQLMAQGERATTSGKAYNALRNDFAARGMLQSGAYQAQRGVLSSELEKQRKAIDEAKANFAVDQQAKLAAQNAANEQARQVALDEAKQAVLSRFAMGA